MMEDSDTEVCETDPLVSKGGGGGGGSIAEVKKQVDPVPEPTQFLLPSGKTRLSLVPESRENSVERDSGNEYEVRFFTIV